MAVLHFKDTEEYWKNVGSDFSEEIAVGGAASGNRLAHFVMSHNKDDMEAPLATMLYMPPNFVLPRHDHDCFRVEVVVEGSVRVGDKVLHPGDVSVSKPREAYGPHIAGPTGCLTVEIFSRQAALAPTMHVDESSEEWVAGMARYEAAVAAWRKAKGKVSEPAE
jgi:hypothetical protein